MLWTPMCSTSQQQQQPSCCDQQCASDDAWAANCMPQELQEPDVIRLALMLCEMLIGMPGLCRGGCLQQWVTAHSA
jgi:hypothetical protein